MTDGFFITPQQKEFYLAAIERERRLNPQGLRDETLTPGTLAVMIVAAPTGRENGKAVTLKIDAAHPFSYELSINGYPGFGVLNTLRGRISKTGREDDPDTSGEFSFPRDSEASAIVFALPKYWRDKVIVTGGRIRYDETNIVGGVASTTARVVQTGRYFIAFSEEPAEFVFAETDAPTQTELITLVGYDDEGALNAAPVDDNGFTTNQDSRVTARVRKVRFVATDHVRDLTTLVDTSQPSPIAAGALAYVAVVSGGFGLSIQSVEPRVYQNLGGYFTQEVLDAAQDIIDNLPES